MFMTTRIQASRLAAVAVSALGAAAGVASAQSAVFVNPGFEEVMPWSSSGEPLGWHNVSNPNGALRRTNGDGNGFPIVARTGTACIELRFNGLQGPGNGGFVGFTTDTLNFNDPNLWFFDPFWDWESGGVIIGGWYNIPAGQAINDNAGLKIEVKLSRADGNPSNQTAWTWENLGITGDTNGEWRLFEIRLSRSAIRRGVFTGRDLGFYTLPPFPHRWKITPLRFAGDGTPTTGTIFWDDMVYQTTCAADYNLDGSVDFFDYLDFVAAFAGEEDAADYNGDFTVDFFDYLDFVAAFAADCP
jgi:hypothetical protein